MLEPRIGIIGLGYVGLPLACLFAQRFSVIGVDIDETRVNTLQAGKDVTNEVSEQQLKEVLQNTNASVGLQLTTTMSDLASCNFYIVTVPTPIDKFSRPNLKPLEKASAAVGAILKEGDFVIYESTVYPGVTEEVCVPILEEVSGLKLNIDFFVGYSPERINPGDKEKTVSKITKITSGSTVEAANYIDQIYATVIEAGTYKAASIKVAEAAKVIENAQRDVNIAFVNELAKIFSLLDIDTQEVLAAAGTKWNFLPFQPGLVGGHCIGVDPFYLAEKAKIHGYYPELLFASRRLNDSMGGFVANQVIKGMIKKDISIKRAKILILGLAFKENCHDVRNSKVIDIYHSLSDYDCKVDIYDPWVDANDVKAQFGLSTLQTKPVKHKYDAIVLAVPHREFLQLDTQPFQKENCYIFDVKGVWGKTADGRL